MQINTNNWSAARKAGEKIWAKWFKKSFLYQKAGQNICLA